MIKGKIVLYMHAGSGNHGCEAIANALCNLLKEPVLLVTNSAIEDKKYSLGKLCEIVEEKKINQNKVRHILYYLWRKVMKDPESFMRYRFKEIAKSKAHFCNISIGGDNYCYDSMIKDLILTNKMLNDQGSKTVLLGCSIEPEILERQDVLEDMKRYSLIIARESLTYQALVEKGMGDHTVLIPDPAFLLEAKYKPLPSNFIENQTIGINISPMIMNSEQTKGITIDNYMALMEHIINTTEMSIALIPHVIWDRNDDRKPLQILYERFKQTNRVVLIEDCSCQDLKGYIARCRMFIGARTHATIAAYSACVPTLVVGYSIKAKGIAKDIFGSYENYVIPVQQLVDKKDLILAYEWLLREEVSIRKSLQIKMPKYNKKIAKIVSVINRNVDIIK